MTATARLRLGAPGLYRAPVPPLRTLTGVRLDVCAFAGVAPRGPARVPIADESVGDRFWRGDVPWVEPERPRRRTVGVAVESFDEYRRLFGGFEGPGRLPYAVAAFFENGGRRAVIARIVHDYGPGDPRNDAGVARAELAGVTPVAGLRARNEGSWGLALRAQLAFNVRPVLLTPAPAGLQLGAGVALPAATLLRVTLDDGTRLLRFVRRIVRVAAGRSSAVEVAELDAPLPGPVRRFEVVEASLALDDGAGRSERHDALGLAFGHPRWIAQVLCEASDLVWPENAWAYDQLLPDDVELPALAPVAFDRAPVTDRWHEIVHEDFFDAAWTPGSDEPGSGICCFAADPEAASLVVPDLYSHAPLGESEPVVPASLAGPRFERCVTPAPPPEQQLPEDDLPGLHLDPALDLDAIVALQNRVIEFAATTQAMVALIDVPPGLQPVAIRRWRAAFTSSWAAAYHPWLTVARRDDARDSLEDIPPSAVAAGIVAARENAFGVAHGPANALAAQVVKLRDRLPPGLHDELHPAGINFFVQGRDGIRLTAARTLAREAAVRQLSVRRLMLLLRRVLERQMQWAVFEGNGPALWRELRQLLDGYLRELYRHGALRGASEEEAFLVRCDETLNPPYAQDQGRLLAEVRVAPAEPLEYIVLRIARAGDGTLTVTE